VGSNLKALGHHLFDKKKIEKNSIFFVSFLVLLPPCLAQVFSKEKHPFSLCCGYLHHPTIVFRFTGGFPIPMSCLHKPVHLFCQLNLSSHSSNLSTSSSSRWCLQRAQRKQKKQGKSQKKNIIKANGVS
jgi:hypothetical protein